MSYDPPDAVRAFADSHRIEYPVLSDVGSQVIRELRILDQDLEAHQAVFGVPTRPEQLGVAYPMTFILDASGRVERKLVEENYRLRYGGDWLVQELLGEPASPPTLEARATGPLATVAGRFWIDSTTYFPYQRRSAQLELSIGPGWHVYGPVVPPGYTGLHVAVQSVPEGVRAGAPEWPPTSPFHIEGLDEEFAVYEGTIAIVVPLEFILPRGSGVARVEIRVTFQTCSATECLPPNAIELVLEVAEAPIP